MEHKTLYEEKIYNILMNMPKNLTDMEKARYLYLELGKMSNFNMDYWYGNAKEQRKIYREGPEYSESVICKTIAEAYRDLLQGSGIKARTVITDDNKSTPHVDTEFEISGKKYICNLQGDLSRIHMRCETEGFCYKEEGYDSLEKNEVKEMDRKLGYLLPTNTYTDVFFNLLKPKIESKNIIEKVEIIRSFANRITKAMEVKGLERTQFYISACKKLLPLDEFQKLKFKTTEMQDGEYETVIEINHGKKKILEL